MTRRSFLAALFLLGMALPASAQQSVPLKGGFGGEVIAASGPATARVLTAEGEGQLTHLGQTSIEQTYVFDLLAGTFAGTGTLPGPGRQLQAAVAQLGVGAGRPVGVGDGRE
jgi:hypothetical protein